MQIWYLHSCQWNSLGLLLYILDFWVPSEEELDFSRLWVENLLYIAASETGQVLMYCITPGVCCCVLVWGGKPLSLCWQSHAFDCSELTTMLYSVSFYLSLIIVFKLRSWASNKTHNFPEELPIMRMHSIIILSPFLFRISIHVFGGRDISTV